MNLLCLPSLAGVSSSDLLGRPVDIAAARVWAAGDDPRQFLSMGCSCLVGVVLTAVQLLNRCHYFQVARVRLARGLRARGAVSAQGSVTGHGTISAQDDVSRAVPRRCWCCIQVRAYDKQAMMPDGLLGSASVDVHHLGQVASPTVPGSGGGRPVQVRRSLQHNPAA